MDNDNSSPGLLDPPYDPTYEEDKEDLSFSDEEEKPVTFEDLLQGLAENDKFFLQRQIGLKKILDMQNEERSLSLASKLSTGHGESSITENVFDSPVVIWNPEIQFAWERESNEQSDATDSKRDFNIFAFYYPQGHEGMTESGWWNVIRGTNGVEDFEAFKQYAANNNAWFDLLARCDTKAGFQYSIDKDIPFSVFVRTSYAPVYLRQRLLVEGGGWETTLAWAVDNFAELKRHLRELERLLRGSQLSEDMEGADRVSCHIHITFKRPPRTVSLESLAAWAVNIRNLACLLNDWAALLMYEKGKLHHPLLAPYLHHQILCLDLFLQLNELCRGTGDEIPLSGIETTSGGLNFGLFKYSCTAFRHVYRASAEAQDYDIERVGFEFRSWWSLQDLCRQVGKVEEILRTVDLFSRDCKISLGGSGESYLLSKLSDFSHVDCSLVLKITNATGEAGEFIKRAILAYVNTGTPDAERGVILLQRCCFPFLAWEYHPAVPPQARGVIVAAREKLLVTLARYAVFLSLPLDSLSEISEDEDLRSSKAVAQRPFEALAHAVKIWSEATQIYKFF